MRRKQRERGGKREKERKKTKGSRIVNEEKIVER
jgi:hypothetical protein